MAERHEDYVISEEQKLIQTIKTVHIVLYRIVE